MKIPFDTLSFFLFLLLSVAPLWACSPSTGEQAQPESEATAPATWSSAHALHLIGLPGTKINLRGELSLTATALNFSSAASVVKIPWPSIVAASTGKDRVELWGKTGRVLRMAIPDGGGLAAASVMHHRISMLTIEFADENGALREAVFQLPDAEAERALHAISGNLPANLPQPLAEPCHGAAAQPHSVMLQVVSEDAVKVPAAYRALLYEQLIDRLQHAKGIGRVYRPGEAQGGQCPQYTVAISVTGFKQGSQVARAAAGPIGMFTSATKMNLDVTISNADGSVKTHESIQSAVRTESESKEVAQKAAKKIAAQIATELKHA
jgi:hypothetical protein